MAALDLVVYAPNARRAVAAFEELPHELLERLVGPLGTLTRALLARVLAGEPEKTGALHGDTHAYVDVHDERVTGRVKVLPEEGERFNFKAVALEYGAHGLAEVAERHMTLDHAWGRAIEPEQELVKAYSRHVNITELAFLRNAAAGMPHEFNEAVEKAMAEMAKAFGG